MVEHVARRTLAANEVNRVVFAVPEGQEDDVLAEYVTHHLGLAVHRGPVDDVLCRFAIAIAAEDPSIVVRVTADDPLKDPALIDRAVRTLVDDPTVDYVSNTLDATFPEGLDVEAIRVEALLLADREAVLPSDREHVTPFIWRQPDRFTIRQFRADRDLSDWRWTLDTVEDANFLSDVLNHFPTGPATYRYQDVVAMLESHPDLLAGMPRVPRGAAYLAMKEAERT